MAGSHQKLGPAMEGCVPGNFRGGRALPTPDLRLPASTTVGHMYAVFGGPV